MRHPDELVTVLMAVHNGAPYLRTAIESVLAQTCQAFRFLIVDDASTDDTRDIVRSYAEARIELLCLPRNVGQTAALNVGLRHAASPWIARMDADDYAAPERLAEQMRAVEADPTLDCVGTFAWVFRDDPRVVDGVIEKPLQDAAIKRQMLRAVPLIHGSLLMRRRAVLEVGGYDERYRYSADWDLYHRWLPRSRAVNLPKPLVGIRRHPQQDSYSRRAVDENLEIFSRLLTTPLGMRRDRAMVRDSLSYTYMMRARLWLGEGKLKEMLGDVGSAFRWSPMMTLKQFVWLGHSPTNRG
jgi:glycosyltransferase involved in cell wall biosynthesis